MSKKGISILKQRIMEDEKKAVSNVEVPQTTGKPLGAENVPGGKPVELPDTVETDTLNMMHTSAMENSINAKADDFSIDVSGILNFEFDDDSFFKYFTIVNEDAPDDKNDYAIYQIDDTIYYRNLREFKQLEQDVKDAVPGAGIERFKNRYDNIRVPLDTRYSISDRDDCSFVICSIFSSITGKSYDNSLIIDRCMNESCKIRKHNKLSSDGLLKKSIKGHEAKYGTADEESFKQEIEDKQKKDGTVGSLDQQQQESAMPQIPNVHIKNIVSENMKRSDINAILEARHEDIYYEPGDKVLVKINDKSDKVPGRVSDVYTSLDYGQILTVIYNGGTIRVTTKEVEPDMTYLVNQLADYTDDYSDIAFDLDLTTGLPKPVKNDDKDYSKDYKDLNDVTVECDIVLNGFKVNFDKHYASLKDIAKSSKYVKVVNESGVEDMWPIDSVSIDEENWPYAVIVNNEDEEEPVHKIRIDPQSYVEAKEDELVDCIINQTKTQVVKKDIRIIS